MKYIKLFESFEEDSDFMRWLKKRHPDQSTWEDMETLICSHYGLKDLVGIGILKNLKTLDCGHNRAVFEDSLSLKGIENLINLEKLYCNSDNVDSLEEIKNLTNLNTLWIYNNKVESLDVIKKLTNLEELNCCFNNLVSLELGEFSIEAFELGIDETDLRKFDKLKVLQCYGNRFSEKYKKYIRKYYMGKDMRLEI